MADISHNVKLPTIQAIYQHYETQARGHRMHLGASQIGKKCSRELWYQFRWAASPEFNGRMRRLFEHGEKEEERVVANLRAIGATVYDIDPSTGKQFTFTAFGGHFGCSLDGAAQGIPESSKWHVTEFKTANDKSFKKTAKAGVESDKPVHYAQMQIGMHLSGMERALYIVVNKNDDDMYGERIEYKLKVATSLLDRAERIIFAEEPPERISDNPAWWECKFCPAHDLCHGRGVAEVNCRTCAHSTPMRDGTWHCARHEFTIDAETQRKGCETHLFRPDLMGLGEAVDAGEDFVEYQSPRGETWRNGPHGPKSYTSEEVRASDDLPAPDDVEDLRVKMGASLKELEHG